jgi:hypothetical protein
MSPKGFTVSYFSSSCHLNGSCFLKGPKTTPLRGDVSINDDADADAAADDDDKASLKISEK